MFFFQFWSFCLGIYFDLNLRQLPHDHDLELPWRQGIQVCGTRLSSLSNVSDLKPLTNYMYTAYDRVFHTGYWFVSFKCIKNCPRGGGSFVVHFIQYASSHWSVASKISHYMAQQSTFAEMVLAYFGNHHGICNGDLIFNPTKCFWRLIINDYRKYFSIIPNNN